MGIQLNLGDHKSFFVDFVPFPKNYVADIQWARSQAKAIANTKPNANAYFRTLSTHKTLSELLNDRSLWVNFHFNAYLLRGYALQYQGRWEIGLSDFAFRNRPILLATLIHELAHVGGAPDDTTQAEEAVYRCGLGSWFEYESGVDDPSTPYDPTRVG